jgi:chromosome segregation ATPase
LDEKNAHLLDLRDLRNIITSLSQQLKTLETTGLEKDRKIEALVAAGSEKDRQINKIQEDFREMNVAHSQFMKEATQKIQTLEQAMSEKGRQIDELRVLIQQQLQVVEERFNALQNSRRTHNENMNSNDPFVETRLYRFRLKDRT